MKHHERRTRRVLNAVEYGDPIMRKDVSEYVALTEQGYINRKANRLTAKGSKLRAKILDSLPAKADA